MTQSGFAVYTEATGQDHFAAPPPRRTGALGIVRSERGRVLMCEKRPIREMSRPWYHPGGCVEATEDIRAGFIRTARAKLGVTLTPGRLLVVHHMPEDEHVYEATDERSVSREGLNFVFDCGTIPESTEFEFGAKVIGARWFEADELAGHVSPFMAQRTLTALAALETGGVELLTGHPQ